MTCLLAWFSWEEAPLDSRVWEAMCTRAQSRCLHTGSPLSGPGWRVWAADTTRLDVAPIHHQRDASGQVCIVLLDRARGRDNESIPMVADLRATRFIDNVPTVALSFETESRRVSAYRDQMGRRALVWAMIPGGIVLASGEDILRVHPSVTADLDRTWLAAFMAALPAQPESTVWRHIRALAAGQTRVWQRSGTHASYRPLERDERWRGRTDRQVQEQFLELLEHAVGDCIAGAQRIGVSLSAGMDSSVVACLAARGNCGPERPLGVTYGFDRWPDIDERAQAADLAQALGLDHVGFLADALMPFAPTCHRPINPDTPLQSPYREWKEEAYRHFSAGNVDLVLSGNFSDHLWAHPRFWLAECMGLGRWRVGLDSLRTIWAAEGVKAILGNWGVRALARPWRLKQVPVPDRVRMLRQPWRDEVHQIWREQAEALKEWPRPAQAMAALNSTANFDAYGEDWFAARHGLAFRQPFRDPALSAWMLSIPADFSYRGYRWKWLMRQAMTQSMPAWVLDRPKASDLRPISRATFAESEESFQELAEETASLYRDLLHPDTGIGLEPADEMWIRAGLALWHAHQPGTAHIVYSEQQDSFI